MDVKFNILNKLSKIPKIEYVVTNEIHHNSSVFTQGLTVENNYLIESAGRYGESRLIISDINSHNQITTIELDDDLYGEGVSVLENYIYQLTWKNGKCLIYNIEDFSLIGITEYEGEGWGLCTHEKSLLMSNGSAYIKYVDKNFRTNKIICINVNGYPINHINDITVHEETIIANIWKSSFLVVASLSTGNVLGKIDCSELVRNISPVSPISYLNGVSLKHTTNTLLITGKYWPVMYEIQLLKR